MKTFIKTFAGPSVFIFYSWQLFAQQSNSFQPSHGEIVQRYQHAARMDSITRNVVYKSNVEAHWQADGKTFWYRNVLKDSLLEYIYADAEKEEKHSLFSAQQLAKGLLEIGIKTDPLRIPITDLKVLRDIHILQLKINDQWIESDLETYKCKKIPEPVSTNKKSPILSERNSADLKPETNAFSPDGQWRAFVKDGNVFINSIKNGTSICFTTDGSATLPYGQLSWSPDSKYLVGYHIHTVVDSPVYYILSSLPGTTRGQLRSHPYKQPGDSFTSFTMFVFRPMEQQTIKVNTDTIDYFFEPAALHWHTINRELFTFERMYRGNQRFRVIEVNASTGDSRTVLEEKSVTFIDLLGNFSYYPKETDLMFHISEKDGWRHIYSIDLISGKEQQITKGNWVVRGIDSIDKLKKEIWFNASGMNPDEDPYYLHYYRIGFDGHNLISLTPETGNHKLVFSPAWEFYIDNYSQVNIPPVTKLHRSRDGKTIMILEEADLSQYRLTGLHPPEVFVAKGRDGKTDIWGIFSRPSIYDSTKKYPILENIYAGPQDSYVPKSFTPYSEMQSLAELGFIVVMIDGMGTANRSKSFHDVCWKNLADAGLPDRILWIKALAKKYSFADTGRVGLYGTSAGGQNALTALLTYPAFYKAGVAACGCHDNRVDKQWWNEQWMGYPIGKEYAEQSNVTNAAKLKGNLLLIVGEGDTNVPPESTYRVADALIKAGKLFDFLPIPGSNHSDGGPYGRIRKRDFFVRHLLGVEPPNINAGELSAVQNPGRERWTFN